MSGRAASLVLLAASLAACTTKLNYEDPAGPRYTGNAPAPVRRAGATADTLRIVSFNIEFAFRVDSAIAVLTSEPELRNADIVLLQEMDDASTRRVANALRMSYAYYPATLHPRTNRDMGNAVLSRWPIVDDGKIVLPHVSRWRRTQRTATAATIQVGASAVRIYSTHLGTQSDIGPEARRDQMRAVLADAEKFPRVVIGGDLNEKGVGEIARAAGYKWPTEKGPRTLIVGRWDHIFTKGLERPDSAEAGTVLNVRNASDHRPVWAVGIIR